MEQRSLVEHVYFRVGRTGFANATKDVVGVVYQHIHSTATQSALLAGDVISDSHHNCWATMHTVLAMIDLRFRRASFEKSNCLIL